VAKEEWLPLDPTESKPPEPCECGSEEFVPEADVLDTWMDSSLSAMAVSGWFFGKEPRVPAQLRPQGHDIIRTWAFYTILRTQALTGKRPWDSILINGMVSGEDGHKMSKSLNNIIAPEEVTKQYGADAFRQWAAIGGSTGSDIMFRWEDVVAASRFQQKMWSIVRFALPHIKDTGVVDKDSLTIIDRWILSRLNTLIIDVTDAMDRYQFDTALRCDGSVPVRYRT
jgi:valyl-tRNA synthetase